MIDTKDRILDAAERLFADYGYSATSLRRIIAEAGVNLAAVHYHFGSKEELLKAAIRRRVEPVNQGRLAKLEELERHAAGGSLTVEEVLEAFLAPTLQVLQTPGGPVFVRLMGRLYVEGDILPRIVHEEFGVILSRFGGALRSALPGIPEEELYWKMHFAIGAMAQALRGTHELPVITGGLCEASDAEATLVRLVAFLSAGFRAPVPEKPE
jgi:AcrR family transcriptional regulator